MMEAALGTGQMSHAAAPGGWFRAGAVRLIKPVSLIPLINDCVCCAVLEFLRSMPVCKIRFSMLLLSMCRTAFFFHAKQRPSVSAKNHYILIIYCVSQADMPVHMDVPCYKTQKLVCQQKDKCLKKKEGM